MISFSMFSGSLSSIPEPVIDQCTDAPNLIFIGQPIVLDERRT